MLSKARCGPSRATSCRGTRYNSRFDRRVASRSTASRRGRQKPCSRHRDGARSGAGTGEDEPLIHAIQSTPVRSLRCRAATRTGRCFAACARRRRRVRRTIEAANPGREYWVQRLGIHEIGPNGQTFVRKGDRGTDRVPGAFISDGVRERRRKSEHSEHSRAARHLRAQPGYSCVGETLDELADHLILNFLFPLRRREGRFAGRRMTAALKPF